MVLYFIELLMFINRHKWGMIISGFHGQLGGGSNEGPKTWPEVVGMAAEEAEKMIKEEMPRALIKIIPQDHFVTMDFRTDRVRIFVDPSGKVARPPSIG